MKIKTLHKWDVIPKEAIAIQNELASHVIYDQPLDLKKIQYVAGVDVSVKDYVSHAAVVVLKFPELEVVETVTATQKTPFPYISGLLSYREAPVLLEAFEKLEREPDVFIFDGMGRIHPRRMGIATHMGLWLGKPTIGCGKTHLLGDYDQPDEEKGSFTYLTHKGETLGAVLRTRTGVKPVYVSVGHLADLTTSISLVLQCTPKYRLPRPIRLAHNAAGEF